MADFHNVPQALAGMDFLGYNAVGCSIDGFALGRNEVNALVLHLQFVDGVVLETHRGAGLNIGHALLLASLDPG